MKAIRISFGILLALAVPAGLLAAADDLPKAETILDKYVEVTGGKAAYAKVRSDIATGTMEFKAMGLKGKLTSYGAAPNKRYVEIVLEGIGKIQEVSNGEMAWSLSAVQGARIKEGEEKDEALLQSRYNADVIWRELYQSAETAGAETVDGKECYKVVMKRKVGSPITRWFDKQTGLLVKMAMISKSPMGEIESTSIFSDYRKEGELLLPHKVTTQVATMEMLMTIDSVQQNAEIPKDKFEAPEEIKALMKKPAAK